MTRGRVAWLENLGSPEKGDSREPMDSLDQLGPRVSQVSRAVLEAQGWQGPWGRRVTLGSPGSQALGALRESQDSRVQLAQSGPRAYLA